MSRNAPPKGEALRDLPKDYCEGDYPLSRSVNYPSRVLQFAFILGAFVWFKLVLLSIITTQPFFKNNVSCFYCCLIDVDLLLTRFKLTADSDTFATQR